MDARTTLTLRCSACGALAEATCKCGAPYAYISPGELAAKGLKDNPEKSSRAIADDLGVGEATVRRARRSTAPNDAVGKRTGKDGRTRRMPRQKRPRQTDPVKDKITAMADQGLSSTKIAANVGVESRAVRHAIERDEIREAARQEAFAEVGVAVDFSKLTAKQKLDAAIRAQKKEYDRNYRLEFMAAVDAHIKRIMPSLLEDQNKAYQREKTYREFMDKQKKIFTKEQFTTIIRCLHPDANPSPETKAEAFRLFNARKFALTGET